jgi:hypothetical protein
MFCVLYTVAHHRRPTRLPVPKFQKSGYKIQIDAVGYTVLVILIISWLPSSVINQ